MSSPSNRIRMTSAGVGESGQRAKNQVTRALIQGSERKKERLLYADPDDHNFNYSSRYVGGGPSLGGTFGAGGFPADEWAESPPRRGDSPYRTMGSPSMPAIRGGPLNKVKPISNEDEDELIQVFKDII